MANTKHLPSDVRKGVKRKQRKEFNKMAASLTPKDHKAIRKSEEKVGLKQFIINKGKSE